MQLEGPLYPCSKTLVPPCLWWNPTFLLLGLCYWDFVKSGRQYYTFSGEELSKYNVRKGHGGSLATALRCPFSTGDLLCPNQLGKQQAAFALKDKLEVDLRESWQLRLSSRSM